MMSKKAGFILSLLFIVSVAIVVYLIVLPGLTARQYEERIQFASKPLNKSFRNLNKSTELPLVIDSSAAMVTKTNNADTILRQIADTRKQLESLNNESKRLSPMSYSDLLGQYDASYVLRDRTQRLINQSDDTLDEYEAFVKYLMVLHGAIDSVASELRSFNEVVDINIYGGQAETIHQIADNIRSSATVLSKANPPSDMAKMNAEMIEAMTKAASGFDDLAYGLVIPADEPIYASARKIENATAEIDRITNEVYDSRISESLTLKNVNDLSDKLELVSVR